MAEDNLKDFTINWIVTGLLVVALLGFAVTFISNNNPTSMGDDADTVFGNTYANMSNNLAESSADADNVLNITSKTNPEISDLGSRDSVASAYSAKSSSISYWDGSKQLLSWTFSGATGKIINLDVCRNIRILKFLFHS